MPSRGCTWQGKISLRSTYLIPQIDIATTILSMVPARCPGLLAMEKPRQKSRPVGRLWLKVGDRSGRRFLALDLGFHHGFLTFVVGRATAAFDLFV
jgi:hypothetical protein